MKLFRILITFILLTTSAFCEDGIVEKEIIVKLNESGSFYIKPVLSLDINEVLGSGSTFDESATIIIYTVFEF